MSNSEAIDTEDWVAKTLPVPSHWSLVDFEEAFHPISTSKIKTAEAQYKDRGAFPIVDQGQDFIGGYTDAEDRVINRNGAVIVFGDHTRCFKLITFPFAPGADGTKILEPRAEILPKFAYYGCLTLRLPDRGYSRHYSFLRSSQFPIAPLAEQRRLVAKIEELFSELDKSIEALTTARKQLKAYRQSVLKHAFEGKLTEKWRADHLNEFKVQGDPLPRIRNVSATQYAKEVAEWQKATAKWRANGHVGNKPIKPERLREQPVFSKKEVDSLPSLPSSWIWIRLGDLFASSPQNGLYKPASTYGRGAPIIRIDSFYDGAIIPDIQLKRLALLPEEIDKYRVKVGDILINRVNSIEYLGKCALVTKIEESTVFESNIMKFTVMDSEISKRYLVAYLSSHGGKSRLCSNAKHAVNQASINQTDVASTPVALPTIAEQHAIANELDALLSETERAEKEVEIQLAKLNVLRQAILKKAFSGQLVAQCADDEPASVLLERIRAERESAPVKSSRNGRNGHAKNRSKNVQKNRKKQLA